MRGNIPVYDGGHRVTRSSLVLVHLSAQSGRDASSNLTRSPELSVRVYVQKSIHLWSEATPSFCLYTGSLVLSHNQMSFPDCLCGNQEKQLMQITGTGEPCTQGISDTAQQRSPPQKLCEKCVDSVFLWTSMFGQTQTALPD
jgi:hypothetical protein